VWSTGILVDENSALDGAPSVSLTDNTKVFGYIRGSNRYRAGRCILACIAIMYIEGEDACADVPYISELNWYPKTTGLPHAFLNSLLRRQSTSPLL